ncbi:MAG: heparan-alpha-glucosaminide N-acetyltransferase domain-containing protein [Acidobacteriaceae bacterium]|nr:heparan-alpha-glucosaminide N-acetyltransferase domain-containing protein [Acidobacteriaceae bacterium]
MAGFSLVLANTPAIRWRPFAKRVGMIAAAAIAISIVTYIGMADEWIYFGILHCIAALSLIGIVFVRLPMAFTLIATILLAGGWITDIFYMPGSLDWDVLDPRYFAWLGFSALPARSNDYVPLFPWALAFFTGLSAARIAVRTNLLQYLARLGSGTNPVARAGRHSLIFYLVHQPVLFGLVYLLSLVAPAPKPDPSVGYLRQCQASCIQSATESICRSFCQCTLDQMKSKNLFEPLQSGKIRADSSEEIQGIAQQCTDQAQ